MSAVRVVMLAGGTAALAGGITGSTPLSYVGALVGFGLAPGLAAVRLLAPGERGAVGVARALFFSPLLAGAAAAALLLAGFAAAAAGTTILVAAYALGIATAFGPAPPRFAPSLPRWDRRLGWWIVALALLALVPHLLREWVRVRSDAWFHAAVVFEIAERGLPPDDPYFAGLRLQYMWLYHSLLAVWSRAAGVAAWDLAGSLNALWLASLGGGIYALSRRVGRPGREALLAAVFVPLGLDALFTLWIPLKLLRALVGETAGWAELERTFSPFPFSIQRAFHFISTWGSPPPLLNKYLVMTALGGAITALAWLAESLAGLVRYGGWRWGALAASAALAAWIWHPGLGLAAVLACGLAGAWLLARPRPGRTADRTSSSVPRSRVLAGAAAVSLGTLAALPLLLATAGETAGRSPLGFNPHAALPILAPSLAALLFGIPALMRLRPTPAARLFQALAGAMMIAAFLVVLPDPNTQDKMPFVFYLLPATAAGWMLARVTRALRWRGRRVLAWAVLLVILVPASALTWAGYLFDPADPDPAPEERALYAWLAQHTPADAVILDSNDRVEALVRVPRRQFWGRETYARIWGYDPAEMDRRRLVRDRLLGPAGPWDESAWRSAAADTAGTARALDVLRGFDRTGIGPVYVLWRPADHGGLEAVGTPLARPPFETLWSNPAATVFRFAPPGGRP